MSKQDAERARTLRAAGWAVQKIADEIGSSYGTTYRAVKEVTPAKRNKQLVPISGEARGHRWDPAEQWLAQHDERYTDSTKEWQTPSTDLLPRIYSGDGNEPHSSLA